MLKLNNVVTKVWQYTLLVILGFLISISLVIIVGEDPLKTTLIFLRSLTFKASLNEVVVAFPASLFCALSFLLALRSGVFNFGTVGQYTIGALCAAVYGILVDIPPAVNIPLGVLSGFIGGALWTIPAAYLKLKRNVNEVITTLLLSFTAPILGTYIAKLPGIKDPTRVNLIASFSVNESARIPAFHIGWIEISGAIPAALTAALIIYVLLWKTRMGVMIRATGLNPIAASYHGIDTNKTMFLTFLLSGGLAGLGGACYILGTAYAYYARTFMGLSGYGLAGIVAAFIGGLHPISSIFSSLFFSVLIVGGLMLNIEAKIPVDYVVLIQGIILAFVAMPSLIPSLIREIKRVRVIKI